MMTDFSVWQSRWLFFALLGGVFLVLFACLAYWAMWQPREMERRRATVPIRGIRSFFAWIPTFMPWVLILTIVGTLVYTVLHVMAAAVTPPNW
jgi:membrane protein required for beta-lactamase induction